MALDYPRQPWDGSAKGMTDFSSVTIWCETAPATPYTIQSRGTETGGWNDQHAVTSDLTTKSTLNAVGRYDLAGGAYFRLNGGTGGTFTISGNI